MSALEDIRKLIRETDHWGLVSHPDGFRMQLCGNDDGVALRLHAGQDYEKKSMEVWRGIAKEGGFLVDVGAHTGVYTLAALKAGARCWSVEPYFLNCSRLMVNLKANGFDVSGVRMVCAGKKRELVEFGASSALPYCGSGNAMGLESGFFMTMVPCFPLDEIVPVDEKVRAIKIDVEGHVREVLEGASRILYDSKPDLLIECTETGLTEVLKPLGYRFQVIDEENGLEDVGMLEPEMEGKAFNMRRINRFCSAR